MAGARGLAVQRVWWNERERRAISVVFFGGGLSGWPGVVHGGTVATVVDESLGRVAILGLEGRTGELVSLRLCVCVTAAFGGGGYGLGSWVWEIFEEVLRADEWEWLGVTANLELSYRAPTLANRFYVLRAEFDESKASLSTDRKKWVKGVLEEVGTGKVCVEAKGLFVVPKGVQLAPFEEGF